jgi:hypothetical protein
MVASPRTQVIGLLPAPSACSDLDEIAEARRQPARYWAVRVKARIWQSADDGALDHAADLEPAHACRSPH